VSKLTPEQQRAIDAAAEQSSLEASARIQTWLRHELKDYIKTALKEIYWELWKDLFSYLIKARWFHVVTGGLTLVSAVWYWIKEHLK